MQKSSIIAITVIALLFSFVALGEVAEASLFATDWSGQLFRVNESTAELTYVGSTGIDGIGALEFGPDGNLYGFGTGINPGFYRIDPTTAAAILIGNMGDAFYYEGGLTFGRDGTAYGVNRGSSSPFSFFSIDVNTGATTEIAEYDVFHNINGLGWRSDGMLVGHSDDGDGDKLLAINPNTGAFSTIANFGFGLGVIGGMTFGPIMDKGFLATGNSTGNAGTSPSNSLYGFDYFTGSTTLIGAFTYAGGDLNPAGISGLAATVPEPTSMLLLGIGLAGMGLIRRRRAQR